MNNFNKLSIIIPCYNEELNFEFCSKEILNYCKKFNFDYEIIFIDDGSTDFTYKKILEFVRKDKKYKLLKLSKNYGSHIAITAGINSVENSDALIVCPLDDTYLFKYIDEMINKFKNGSEIIWSIRKKRSLGLINNFFTTLFYKIFILFSGFKNYPSKGTSAFFLIGKNAYENFKKFNDKTIMVNMLIHSMGYKHDFIEYPTDKNVRTSSFTFFKRLKVAIDGIVSYSYLPIRIISFLGVVLSILAFMLILVTLYDYIFNNITVEGFTTIIIVISLIGGVQLLTLGILGEYIWRISENAKNNPLYLVEEKINFSNETTERI